MILNDPIFPLHIIIRKNVIFNDPTFLCEESWPDRKKNLQNSYFLKSPEMQFQLFAM